MKWNTIPQEIAFAAEEANKKLAGTEHITVRFEPSDCLRVSRQEDELVIGYSRIGEALRGMSMARRLWDSGETVIQRAKYDTMTFMADCSRNAVLKPEAVKELVVDLAMMGYTSLMLYTEDTYEIPGEPYFGHMRGRYTMEELKQLDAYGAALGIELIPCIQVLAHLNNIFNWPAYAKVNDLDDILVADDPETYALVDRMLCVCRECFGSKRILVGMDEAHLLGRGNYLDKYGYSPKPDIMLRHIAGVLKLCKKYDFAPVMWGDMFFRMQFGTYNNITEGELSAEVLAKLPEGMDQCYWTYYNYRQMEPTLDHMFAQFARMDREIWFAGGCWTWHGVTPKNYYSQAIIPVQLRYAEKYGVKNIIATAWGDDGAECSMFSMLPTLMMYGELNYSPADAQTLELRFRDCFAMSFADFMKVDQVALPEQTGIEHLASMPTQYERMAMYNDVLLGIMDRDLEQGPGPEYYREAAQVLAGVPENRHSVLFETQRQLARVLEIKSDLPRRIKAAYRIGDKQALAEILDRDFPELDLRLDGFLQAFRTQWYTYNRPFGFEVQEMIVGGMRERLKGAGARIRAYLNGEVEHLEELEQPDLPYDPDKHTAYLNNWKKNFTACRMTVAM